MGQLGQELELFEMFQSFKGYDARKRKSTVENDTGSWRLFTGLAVQTILHSPTLFYSTYADIKKLA